MILADTPLVKPEVVFIDELLDEIEQGRLRVPKFQRPFVWQPLDMRSLFDSISCGYPIGSILLWESAKPCESLDKIGPVSCVKSPEPPVTYILDGHQRLATLIGGLRLPKDWALTEKQSDWQWWIWFDLKHKEFAHVTNVKPESWFLPVSAVSKTVDFLEAARNIQQKHQKESSEYIEEAEKLAQKVKSYKIAVIRIKGGSLEQAVTIFSRLNTKGQTITPDQMVSALTYREGKNEINLSERIDEILQKLSDYNFGNIRRLTVFHAIIAASGRGIPKSEWENLAKKLGKDLPKAADDAEKALLEAARFLYEEIEVPGDRFLPYAHQLLMLSVFFNKCQRPDDAQKEMLIKWFWITSLSGWFAGANSTKLNKMLDLVRNFAEQKEQLFSIDSSEKIKPFPTRFDMKSARVRALLINMIMLKPLDPETGEPIDINQILSAYGKETLPYIFRTNDKSIMGSPANRIFLKKKTGVSIKALLSKINSGKIKQVLESHAISEESYKHLLDDNAEGFIESRTRYMAKLEHEIMGKIGIDIPLDVTSGETDIDTDD